MAENLIALAVEARQLGILPRAARRWAAAGKFPAKLIGRDYLIEAGTLREYAATRRRKPSKAKDGGRTLMKT